MEGGRMSTEQPDTTHAPKSVDERISEDLGMDVQALEQQLRFRLDIARIDRGEPAELGYVFMSRDRNPDAVIVYDTVEAARAAMDESPLIESLAEEDCLDCHVPDRVTAADLAGKEIILP
jgi:hypothetical protein